jgi:hypothetical protein
MKTKNNAQEKVNGQVREMIFRGITVIISVVLISWTVGAQNFWEQVLTNQSSANMASKASDNPFETSPVNLNVDAIEFKEAARENISAEATFESIEAELENQVEEYNAADFVEAEFSNEVETWMNGVSEANFDAIEEELENQVQEYNAADFVELELEAASNADTDSQINYDAIEAGLEFQIEKFDAAKYVEAELLLEAQNQNDGNAEFLLEAAEAELAPEIGNLMKNSEYKAETYVSAEMTAEIEKLKAEKEFLNKAENETAREAEQQVEKYAMHMVSHLKNGSKE